MPAEPAPGPVARARDQAARAARMSRVTVRTVTDVSELAQVVALLDDVWSNSGAPLVGVEHLRALAYTGGYVGAAFDGARMVAASVAFFAAPPGKVVHSDVTGVRGSARGRHVGFAVKLHQRAWALGLGITEITWTFDPLLSRNAHLNLHRLRARAVSYEEDFYGDMSDGINAGQGSDRLLTSWLLESSDVVSACDGAASRAVFPATPAVLREVDGRPFPVEVDADRNLVRVELPADMEAVRRSDAGLGRAWRLAVRAALGEELASGARVLTFERGAGYVIDRGRASADRGR